MKSIFLQNLQKHSRPIFIRKVEKIPKTANFKNRKVELVAEGFNTGLNKKLKFLIYFSSEV